MYFCECAPLEEPMTFALFLNEFGINIIAIKILCCAFLRGSRVFY
jgi:hypothetical protein